MPKRSSELSVIGTLGVGLLSFFFGILGALAFDSVVGHLGVYKDSLDALQSIVAIAAIVAGGYWWVRRRSSLPRSDIGLSVSHRKLAKESNWLRVSVRIENKGEVLLKLAHAQILVQQVLPLPSQIAKSISEGLSIIPDDQTEILWPYLAESTRVPKGCEIEPGETDTLNWDFVVPQVSTVLVYAHFKNVQKGQLGWAGSLVYDVNGGTSADTDSESRDAR